MFSARSEHVTIIFLWTNARSEHVAINSFYKYKELTPVNVVNRNTFEQFLITENKYMKGDNLKIF